MSANTQMKQPIYKLIIPALGTIALLISACATNAVANDAPNSPKGLSNCVPVAQLNKDAKKSPITTLGKEATQEIAKDLGKDKRDLAVVYAVDRNGKVTAYIPATLANKEAKLCDFKLPIHAGDLTSLTNLTIFSTSNTKTCWTTGSGDEKCIEY